MASASVQGGPSDDFFGTSYIGANPYTNPTAAYLGNLSQIHAMVSQKATGGDGAPATGSGTGGVVTAQGGPSTPSWTPPPPTNSWFPPSYNATGSPAANTQQNNPYNTTQTGGVYPANNNPPSTFDYSGYPGIPPDTQNLRTNIGSYLNSFLANGGTTPNPYTGTFNLAPPQGSQEEYTMANNLGPLIMGMATPGQNTLGGIMMNGGANFGQLQPALSTLLGGPTPQLDMTNINAMANAGFNGAMGFGNNAVTAANTFGNNAWGAGQQYAGMGTNAYMSANPTAQNIAQTGGTNMAQLMATLNAIQNSGQTNINTNLANIRQQYSAQGLGQGSDVSNALALGATQGQQQIEAQQSQYMTNAMQAATQAQLGGVNALLGIGSGLGTIGSNLAGTALGVGNLIGGTNTAAGGLVNSAAGTAGSLFTGGQQLGLQAQQTGINAMLGALNPGLNILQQPVTNQLQAANALPAYLSQYNNAYGTAMGGMNNLAGLSQQANMYTNQAQYQDFLRMQGLTPQMQAALGFATSYPPIQQPIPSTGAMLGAAGISAGGSILGGWLGGLGTAAGLAALSDREWKENIEPIPTVLSNLRALPIYRWNYKGDSVKHIGPMAQDFKKTFGVGDGHQIHLVDVMGVLLQSMKDLSYAVN